MSRSIVFPLLALCGIILYGTTQASQPTPESLMEMDRTTMRPGRMDISPGHAGPDQAALRSPSTPAPPPAPRLRSEEEVEPTAPEPEPRDSAAADRVLPADGTAVPVTTSSARHDADGLPVGADSDDR